MIHLVDTEQQLTKDEMNDFLATFPYEIPREYRSFILSYNGGIPEPNMFVRSKDERAFIIHEFYSIKYGDLTVEIMLDNFKRLQGPEEMLPFANDEGGNHFCMVLQGAQKGGVFLYYIDGSIPNPELLAPSFNAFINQIVQEEEEEGIY